MDKKEVLSLLTSEMKDYENLAKRSALDALIGPVDERKSTEDTALTYYNTWSGIKLAYNKIAAMW